MPSTYIDREECIGDSLVKLNSNFFGLDTDITNVNTRVTNLSSQSLIRNDSSNFNYNGQILTPNRPAFHISSSGAFSRFVTDNGPVIWNAPTDFSSTVLLNTGNCFNIANGRFTCTVPGLYLFNFIISYISSSSSHMGDFFLYKNTTSIGLPIVMRPTVGTWGNGSLSIPVNLSVGDYVYVGAAAYSGNSGSVYVHFNGLFIG